MWSHRPSLCLRAVSGRHEEQSAPTDPTNIELGGAVRKRRAVERETWLSSGLHGGEGFSAGGRWSAVHSSQEWSRRGGTGCPRESEQHGHSPRMAGRCGASED